MVDKWPSTTRDQTVPLAITPSIATWSTSWPQSTTFITITVFKIRKWVAPLNQWWCLSKVLQLAAPFIRRKSINLGMILMFNIGVINCPTTQPIVWVEQGPSGLLWSALVLTANKTFIREVWWKTITTWWWIIPLVTMGKFKFYMEDSDRREIQWMMQREEDISRTT